MIHFNRLEYGLIINLSKYDLVVQSVGVIE